MTNKFIVVFLFAVGMFSVNAQDLIILRNGNVIEAIVIEITPSEIRYRRFDHLEGPVIVIPADSVHSIRYENGIVEIINPASPRSPVRVLDEWVFGINVDLLGFVFAGPSAIAELTRNRVNMRLNLRFPSLSPNSRLYYSEYRSNYSKEGYFDGLFGLGLGLNYFHRLWIGGFYAGAMAEITRGRYKSESREYIFSHGQWWSPPGSVIVEAGDSVSYTLAMNIGYKFVLQSGITFRAGGYLGMESVTPLGRMFIYRPELTIGYSF